MTTARRVWSSRIEAALESLSMATSGSASLQGDRLTFPSDDWRRLLDIRWRRYAIG